MTWRVVLVVLAVGQVVSPVLVTALGGGEFTTSDRAGEPAIVPAGYAFSIWGLVEALCLAYAVWALVTRTPGQQVRDRLARPLSVVFAGFTLWLVAAEVEPVWSTVAVFVVMVTALLKALSTALRHAADIARWHRAPRVLLWSMLGVYTGWSSVAIWVNLTTALAESGAPVDGPVGVAWALVAVVVAAAQAGQPVPAVIAAVASVCVGAATALFRLRRPALS
ncbi:hypothetical protein V1227_13350 [Lentzea sp. DG1S-22]|uniref:hypothetical protein n=1 Tax=Lentzea sp. DG1S-22 TaxID=3108822 RepID=UPI002E78E4FA|nr:hypothetical protein [Lentzea sp. DG1S-22]WVH83690.1 hypothetical protein V1227_13350 [Lentzea sp. DG1S-22]